MVCAAAALAALILVFALLAAENLLVGAARKKLSLVILVNGTRGKSTVTRMLHCLLREAPGFAPVFGKTTGSAAMLLLPDGTERPLRRICGGNVREQRNCLIGAAFSGAKTLVFECNAVKPELQKITARWLVPDIMVVTNVREDHADALGKPEQAARVFAQVPPKNSVLITSDRAFAHIWEEEAPRRGYRLCLHSPEEALAGDRFPENTACVLAAAACLGLDRRKAEGAAKNYAPDPGEFTVLSWKEDSRSGPSPAGAGRTVFFADARSANDTASTDALLQAAEGTLEGAGARRGSCAGRVFLLVNREDRPDRTAAFAEYLAARCTGSDGCVVLGRAPAAFRNKLKRAGLKPVYLGAGAKSADIDRAWDAALPAAPEGDPVFVFALGNYGGAGSCVTTYLAEKRVLHDVRVQA
ncbi:MAG: hypothetical protein LBR23_07195 [Spirochaetaceae bacterium]|nr:hypothetical protein [Spirochaetaceae bacterium]